jgi:predicted ATPase
MGKLYKAHIKGFKSIKDQELEFGALNVVIGGNGAGKSNLIEVFSFLSQIYEQRLQAYTGESGGANSILHFGRKTTKSLYVKVEFANSETDSNLYSFELIPTDNDRFLFEKECTYYWDKKSYPTSAYNDGFWSGHEEARVSKEKTRVSRYVRNHLNSYRIYHFHDTSSSAPVKQTGDLEDNRYLRPDAGNLAAFLYMLQETEPDYYENIKDTIKQIAPFFGDFRLRPSALNKEKIRLEWVEKGSDTYFSAASFSDGTLRFICLATLLLQPDLPSLVLIDEPELGLHPAAIQVLSGLLLSAATRTQLIVSTQSVTLINQLSPENIFVVDREDGESVFRHLKDDDMSSWLDDYGLGELWEKNVLGGRP